ncbi:hypothetical protein CAAN1_22S00804 [[Candida] anglica]|uniref:Uncharacterized protein n=1 Tax=[Candida] anglica TaxID=148631 RepID=A0ABP0EKT7_9ASCO
MPSVVPETPETPLHPQPNEELTEIPQGDLPASMAANLELNPELYDDDDDNDNNNNNNDNNNDDNMDIDGGNEEVLDNQSSDSDEDFEDVTIEVPSFTLPFDKAFELLQSEFNGQLNKVTISLSQQSRLINYIDEQLLFIQRKFIRSHVEDQPEYSMMSLLKDISKIVGLVWYSIDHKNKLFGQPDYLIKIMGDLEEYIVRLEIPQSVEEVTNESKAELGELFTILQDLDTRLAFLIDGYESELDSGLKRVEKLSTTESVRLAPITSRLRLVVIERLEPLRLKLSQSSTKSSRELLNILEVETGKLFEGIFERI